MFVEDNSSKHIKTLIERYGVPSDVGAEALRLGGHLGLTLVAGWVREQRWQAGVTDAGGLAGAKRESEGKARSTLTLRQGVEAQAADYMRRCLAARAGEAKAGQEDEEELVLKIHPDVANVVRRAGKSSPLRLWHLGRALDAPGSGGVSLKELWAVWRDLRVSGRKQFLNVVKAGEGIFWRRDGDRLWLRGLEAVCRQFGVEKLVCDPILLPATVLGDGLRAWNVGLFKAFLKGRPGGDNPIARETLAALTGAAPSTQRLYHPLYEGRTGVVDKRANYALVERPANADVAAQGERLASQRWDDGGAFPWRGEHGQLYWARRLGNTYKVTGLTKAARGRCRAVNHRLAVGLVETWSGQDRDGHAQSREQERATVPARGQGNGRREGGGRLYWRNGRALERAGVQGRVGMGFLDIGETKRRRAGIWLVRRY